MHEAKTRLSELVRKAEAGDEVVITRRGEPVVRLAPVGKKKQFDYESIRGVWRGKVWMADDFDELPDDMAEAFGMK